MAWAKVSYQKEINKIIRQLQNYRPEKVILFGSVAREEADADSDIDLLIIKKTQKPFHRRIREILDLVDSVKVEPLVFTPEEIKQRLALKDFFLTRVINEGKILYENQ